MNDRKININDKPNFSGIYCIKNKINNMVYIGLSKNIHNRWIEHKYRLNTHIHPNMKLQNAWDKYGEQSFDFFVLEKCDYDIIYDREKYWINEYKSFERTHGYNLSTGGENSSEGCVWNDEMKENASKVKNPKKVVQIDIYGNIINTWRSASYASRSLNLRCSSIKKCCEHQNIQCNNFLWFYEEDDLLKDKNAFKNFVINNSRSIQIPILQYDLYGNIIEKFSNCKEIKNKYNINPIEIRECCNHHRNTSQGYIWLFELDDYELTSEYLLKCRISCGQYMLEQYDLDGNYIAEYNKDNLPNEYMLDVVRANCNNVCKTAYGFVWKYKGDNNKIITKDYIFSNDIYGKYKKLYVYNLNKELIKIYDSLQQAVNDGYSASRIRKCCSGEIKTYKKLIWKYREAN